MRKLILSFLILVFIGGLSLVSAQDALFDKEKVERVGDKISEILERNDQSLTDKFLVLLHNKIREVTNARTEAILSHVLNYLHRDGYSVGNNMEWYENEKFGFKMLIPKIVDVYDGSDGTNVEVVASDNGIVLIPEGYDATDRSSRNITIGNIEKSLLDKDMQLFVDSAYRKDYYPNCMFAGFKERKNSLYKTIDIVSSQEDGYTGCLLNFAHVDMYDSNVSKAVSWKLGQAVNFMNEFIIDGKRKDIAYDSIMTDSFRFIE